MKVDRVARVLIALLILVLLVAVLAAVLFVSESALNVWARLGSGPAIFRYAFVGLLVSALLAGVWAVWRFVVPRRRAAEPAAAALTEETLNEELAAAERLGADVGAARAELGELARRRADRTVQVCVFGEVSAGKSTLIAALLPGAAVTTSPVGGSTSQIMHYTWSGPDGGEVLLTDLPGTGSAGVNLDAQAREEALRAHVVLYVCEGDLNRQQLAALRELGTLDKPLIVVMNKTDRFDEQAVKKLRARVAERLAALDNAAARSPVVSVSAGGREEVVVVAPNGEERREVRERAPDLSALKLAIREMLARDPQTLALLRDRAVFRLAKEKLSAAQQSYRRERAEAIVRSSTKKAIVGALAAISPGSDIVIQGYLATTMTRDLCALWGVPVRDMDVEEFLRLSQGRVGKALPLTLAVAGNGLKAFPGLGTVAGGLVHAVAYGLIFDALGHSLAESLAERGELVPAKAAGEFEERLGTHLEKGARRVVRLALEDRGERDERAQ